MSDFKDIANAVAKFAPGIATALLGPIGGTFVSLLENAFGVKQNELSNAINNDPTAADKLHNLELQHQYAIALLRQKNYETEVNDRKSARERDISIKDDLFLHVIAVVYIVGFFVYVSLSYFSPAKFDRGIFHDLLNVSMLILSFYFGSSYKNMKS